MEKEKILNLILGQIFNATTEDDILVYDAKNGRFTVGGKVLPPTQSQEIIESAKALHVNVLWQYLLKELEYSGSMRMAINAADWDSVRFPKANLYVADLMRRKVDTLRTLEVKQSGKTKQEK